MHQTHLRSIDLNLLPVLDALLQHRNATRAGEAVGLSQPAMSRALGRLRDLLDDPLLVRGPRGLVLSPRAEALRQPLAALLQDLRGLLVDPPFDPAHEQRLVRIAMTDAQAELLLVPLVQRLAAEAPGVIAEWVPIGPGLRDRMLAGEVDLAMALDTTPLPRGAMSRPLFDDRLVVVMRRGHPAAGRWALGDYARWPSVVIALLGDPASDIDAELAGAGITRRVAAIVPTFRASIDIVAGSDAVTTVSRAFAARMATSQDLVLVDPPLAQTRLGVVMVWAAHRQADPVLRWLGEVLRQCVAYE
jgi:DNA-binding transcriptional LysR family regulator